MITSGHGLPNDYVIHCLGPVHGRDEPSAQLLADCYRNALRLADEHQLHSIAFPAISTGAFGYPMQEASGVALGTLRHAASSLRTVRRIRMVLFTRADLELHRPALAEIDAGVKRRLSATDRTSSEGRST